MPTPTQSENLHKVLSKLLYRFKNAAVVDGEMTAQAFNRMTGYNSYNATLQIINAIKLAFPEHENEIRAFVDQSTQGSGWKNDFVAGLIGQEQAANLASRIHTQWKQNPFTLNVKVHNYAVSQECALAAA